MPKGKKKKIITFTNFMKQETMKLQRTEYVTKREHSMGSYVKNGDRILPLGKNSVKYTDVDILSYSLVWGLKGKAGSLTSYTFSSACDTYLWKTLAVPNCGREKRKSIWLQQKPTKKPSLSPLPAFLSHMFTKGEIFNGYSFWRYNAGLNLWHSSHRLNLEKQRLQLLWQ